MLVEYLAQNIAGAGGLLVVGLNALERLLAAKLPYQLAPQGAHHRAVGLDHRIAWRDPITHQHHAIHGGQLRYASVLQHNVEAQQLTWRRA